MTDIPDIETKGFVRVKYPSDLRTAVERSVSSWKEFCKLSEEEKSLFSKSDRIKDFGYMRRKDNSIKADDKELFHASKQNMPVLEEKALAIGNKQAISFMHDVDELIGQIKPIILNFVNLIEETYGIENLGNKVLDGMDGWTFRYPHYFPVQGEMMANAHADRGDMTLHLYEDYDGGEYLDFKDVWKPWPVSKEEAIIFPAMGLQYETDGNLKALWHRIKTTEKTREVGRYALVSFIDFNMDYSWDSSKYRIQETKEGFNYSMPFKEFQKFFAPHKLQM